MDSIIAHHHFHPSFTTIKPKLQPNFEKPTKCKKTKKVQANAWKFKIQLGEVHRHMYRI
jgi:hypothetical protein